MGKGCLIVHLFCILIKLYSMRYLRIWILYVLWLPLHVVNGQTLWNTPTSYKD